MKMKKRVINVLNQEVELADIAITLCPADIKALEEITGIMLHNDADDDIEDYYSDNELGEKIANAIVSLIRNYPGTNWVSDIK